MNAKGYGRDELDQYPEGMGILWLDDGWTVEHDVVEDQLVETWVHAERERTIQRTRRIAEAPEGLH